MADIQAAKRYAQAALAIAIDGGRGSVATWRSDLDDVARVLTESALAPLVSNERIPVEQRYALLERALDVQPLALNLAKLLVAKGRSADARAVADAFSRLADGHEGIALASITTAVPLDAAQVAAIEQRLSSQLGKQVRATSTTDPSILGGVVVRVGDKLIDGSVQTRLRQLRRELEGAR